MKKRLAIIGASYLQKPLVLKAQQMGFDTHVFAWEEGAVCRDLANQFYPISITDKKAILDVCKELNISGVVSIASDLASVTVNHLADRLGLIGNSIECTSVTTNKYLMRRRLRVAGIACPEFVKCTQAEASETLNLLNYPVIVKPVDRSGSRGVSLVEKASKLSQAIDYACRESLSGEAIIEEYISGREISVEAISWQGRHYILQYTDKDTTGAPHYVEKAHHQPAYLTQCETNSVSEMVLNALDALGIDYGASHTEIRFDSNGNPFIIEVGARMGGDFIGSDLVELSTGYDFVRGVIEVATGSFSEPVISKRGHSGIHYVYPKPGILSAVIFKGSDHVVSHNVLVPMGSTISTICESSQRSAYYTYKSDKRMEFDPNELVLLTEDR